MLNLGIPTCLGNSMSSQFNKCHNSDFAAFEYIQLSEEAQANQRCVIQVTKALFLFPGYNNDSFLILSLTSTSSCYKLAPQIILMRHPFQFANDESFFHICSLFPQSHRTLCGLFFLAPYYQLLLISALCCCAL